MKETLLAMSPDEPKRVSGSFLRTFLVEDAQTFCTKGVSAFSIRLPNGKLFGPTTSIVNVKYDGEQVELSLTKNGELEVSRFAGVNELGMAIMEPMETVSDLSFFKLDEAEILFEFDDSIRKRRMEEIDLLAIEEEYFLVVPQ